MNERIKHLAEQALREVTEHGFSDAVYRPNGFAASASKAFADRFAELIVQECVDIISPYTVRMSRPGEEYLHPIQEIEKHFGVEE